MTRHSHTPAAPPGPLLPAPIAHPCSPSPVHRLVRWHRSTCPLQQPRPQVCILTGCKVLVCLQFVDNTSVSAADWVCSWSSSPLSLSGRSESRHSVLFTASLPRLSSHLARSLMRSHCRKHSRIPHTPINY